MDATNTPLVSVITCCYNSAKFLQDTIHSVCEQKFQDFEYIFVDGGSTDGTLEIINRYVEGDSEKFKLFHQTTKGLMRARNIGIQQAKGKYICFIDGDDIWSNEKLERQVSYYEQHPEYGLLFTNCVNIDENGIVIPGTGKKDTPDLTIGGLFKHCYISNPTVMVKKDIYNEIGYFDETLPYSEDWDMWLRIAIKYPLAYIPDVLAWYRVHRNNMSTGSLKHYDYQVHVMKKIAALEPKLSTLLPKRLGSIYMVKARKQLKELDKQGARESFAKAKQVFPQRTLVYLLGIFLTYLPRNLLLRFVREN